MVAGDGPAPEDFWALSDVSFEIRRGETFAVIGENGSGKSTLLKCLVGILTPERGRVSVNGSLSAMLELGSGFHPGAFRRENVYLNAALLGVPKRVIKAKFDDIVEFAGLQRFIDMPVKDYSSGMYVRLGFAVAINVEPEVLVIDEVLAVGDESFQRKCMEKFADLRSQGRTVAIVTHTLGTVRTLCDRAVWLKQGRVEMIGDPAEVVDAYVGRGARGSRDHASGGHPLGLGRGPHRRHRAAQQPRRAHRRVHTGDSVTFRLDYHRARPDLQARVRTGAVPARRRPRHQPRTAATPGGFRTSSRGLGWWRSPSAPDAPRGHLRPQRLAVRLHLHPLLRHAPSRVPLRRQRGTPYESDGLVTLDPSWQVDAFEYPGHRISR